MTNVNPQAPIIQASSRLVCAGQSVTLTATGCSLPSVARWNTGQTGNPLLITPTQTTNFYAVCAIGEVISEASNSILVTVSNSVTISGQSSYTAGQTILLTATASPSAGATYTWSGPQLDGAESYSSAGAVLQRIGATANYSGTYTVKATNNDGCLGQASVQVVVAPASCSGITAAISAPAAITAGQTLTLTGSVNPANASATYRWSGPAGSGPAWSGPAGFTSTASAPAIPVATTANSGVYSLTVTLPGGCTATAIATVTVVPAATTSCAGTSVTVIAPASLTAGQTLPLSAVSSPAGSSATYTWTGPAGFTSTASAPAIPNTTTANSGTYSLTIALAGPNGCTATASASVTVVPAGTTACTGLSASIAAPAGVTAGQPLSLTAIVSLGSAGMVYVWRGPAGFTATTPVAAIPTATTVHSGTYSLTVQVAGQSSCSATAATTITVVSSTDTLTTDCDIRIVSVDAAGQETVFIPRSVTGQNALTLSVESLDGTPLTGYTYRWTRTTGVQTASAASTTTSSGTATAPVTVTAGTTPTISVSAIGEYMVVITDAAGNTCVAYSTISAKPCNERTAAYSSCKDVTITNPDATNAISNLAPGDQFYAGDYKVTVTSITGGGSGGWTGEGIVDVTLLKGINLPAQVTFDNAKLNDCYELAAGKLVTKYDPSWSNFVTIDITTEAIHHISSNLEDLINNFTGNDDDKNEIGNQINNINEQLAALEANSELDQQVKADMTEELENAKCALEQAQYSLSSLNGGRIATSSCSACSDDPDPVKKALACIKKAQQFASSSASKVWDNLKKLFCNGDYPPSEGIVPRCWWIDADFTPACMIPGAYCPLQKAMLAGMIDATWEDYKGIYSLLKIDACQHEFIPNGVTFIDNREMFNSAHCKKLRETANPLLNIAEKNIKKESLLDIASSQFSEFINFFTDDTNCGPDATPMACRAYKGGKAIIYIAEIIEAAGAIKALGQLSVAGLKIAMKKAVTAGNALKASGTVKYVFNKARKGFDIVWKNNLVLGTRTKRGLELAKVVDDMPARDVITKFDDEVYNPRTNETEIVTVEVDAQARCKVGTKCFVAGTPVHTRQGIRPIERIKPGDEVLSRDEQTGQQTYKRVTRTFVKTATRLVKVFAGNDTLLTTPEHPFRIGNRWVGAGILHKGDALQQAEVATAANVPYLPRANLEVDSIAALDTTATVYNFEVADFHTYFVGRQGVWVHNTCLISKGGKTISEEINDIVDQVFSNPNKLSHLIYGSTNSVHRWESLVPNLNSADILDIVKEVLEHGRNELYNGKTLTKVADITRKGVTKEAQITYVMINGKIMPSNGWVKP